MSWRNAGCYPWQGWLNGNSFRHGIADAGVLVEAGARPFEWPVIFDEPMRRFRDV